MCAVQYTLKKVELFLTITIRSRQISIIITAEPALRIEEGLGNPQRKEEAHQNTVTGPNYLDLALKTA